MERNYSNVTLAETKFVGFGGELRCITLNCNTLPASADTESIVLLQLFVVVIVQMMVPFVVEVARSMTFKVIFVCAAGTEWVVACKFLTVPDSVRIIWLPADKLNCPCPIILS